MKKLIAMLLALVMVLSLVACAGKNEPEAPVVEEPKAEAPVVEETEAPVVEETEAPADEVKVMTYAEFAAAELDTPVVVETYVQAVESWWDGCVQLYTQAEDGAYYVYDLACEEADAAAFVPGTKIRVSGYKAAWAGEVEIIDATYEILDGNYIATATDVTELVGTDALADHMNQLVSIKGLTVAPSTDPNGNEVAYLYKWDGSGSQGDDLYFNVSMGENVYTFTVNAYMIGTGADSDVYKAIEGLKVGDVIDIEGFLYWYDAAQPHVTSVTVAG